MWGHVRLRRDTSKCEIIRSFSLSVVDLRSPSSDIRSPEMPPGKQTLDDASVQQSEHEAADPTDGEQCMQHHDPPRMRFATQMIAEEEEPSQSGQNQNGDTVLNRSGAGRG
jgi:hypothetical protein